MTSALRASDFFDLVGQPAALPREPVHAKLNYFLPLENADVRFDLSVVQVRYSFAVYNELLTGATVQKEEKMKGLLSYDLQDLAVMIGVGSFVGSAAGVLWSAVFSVSAPPSVIIPASLIGLAVGRLLSEKSKRRVHGH